MKDVQINIRSSTKRLLAAVVANANGNTVTNAVQPAGASGNSLMPYPLDVWTGDNGAIVELIVDGKIITFPAKLLAVAAESEMTTRPMAPAVPFTAPTSYPNFDAECTAAINGMGFGLNYGQVWETIPRPASTGGAVYTQPGAYRSLQVCAETLRRIKAQGFGHIRLPCNWATNADIVAPWTIQQAQLTKYKANIDMILAAGMKVIVNQHQSALAAAEANWTTYPGGTTLNRAQILERQRAIITQVAAGLVGYAATDVFLEIENEPRVGGGATTANPGWTSDEWEAYWPGTIASVRAANPNIIVLLGGNNFNSTVNMANMGTINDARTCLMAHPYEPANTWSHVNSTALWTIVSKAAMQASIDRAAAQVQLRGKPCVMSEVGTRLWAPRTHLAMYARDVRNACFAVGMPFTWWNWVADFACYDFGRGKFFPDFILGISGKPETVLVQPVGSDGNLLDWPHIYGVYTPSGSNNINTNEMIQSPARAADDTFTFDRVGNYSFPYVGTKGADFLPDKRYRLVLTCSAGVKVRMSWCRMAPQLGVAATAAAWPENVYFGSYITPESPSQPAYAPWGTGVFELYGPAAVVGDVAGSYRYEVDPYMCAFTFEVTIAGATCKALLLPV